MNFLRLVVLSVQNNLLEELVLFTHQKQPMYDWTEWDHMLFLGFMSLLLSYVCINNDDVNNKKHIEREKFKQIEIELNKTDIERASDTARFEFEEYKHERIELANEEYEEARFIGFDDAKNILKDDLSNTAPSIDQFNKIYFISITVVVLTALIAVCAISQTIPPPPRSANSIF